MDDPKTVVFKYFLYLTTKPEVSQTLFDRYLIGCLWTDGHQTWQGVGDAHSKDLPGPVSMAAIMLLWQPKKRSFLWQPKKRSFSGLWLDIRLPVTSQTMTSHRQ